VTVCARLIAVVVHIVTDIGFILQDAVTSEKLPADPNGVYMIIASADVETRPRVFAVTTAGFMGINLFPYLTSRTSSERFKVTQIGAPPFVLGRPLLQLHRNCASYNFVLGSHPYLTQELWVDAHGGYCAMRWGD